jgi:UDP-glucose 4-epimerase
VGAVVNLGSAEEVSIDELAARVLAATGGGGRVRHVPHAAVYGPDYHDHRRRVPDLAVAEALLGWRPWTPLDEVVRAVVEHESGVGGR